MGKSPNTQVKGGQGGHFTYKRGQKEELLKKEEKGGKKRNLTP